MITFLDGPAEGARLNLRRAPIFLRVVLDASGEIDALDQLDDEPRPTEAIHVYSRTGPPSRGIACTRGHGCHPFVVAEYRYWQGQPSEDVLRNTEKWQAWCLERKAAYDAARPVR